MTIQISLTQWVKDSRNGFNCITSHIEAEEVIKYSSKGKKFIGFMTKSRVCNGKITDWSGIYYSENDDIIEL